MTLRDWQALSPATAAAEIHRRARTLLSPGQQRAVLAWLCPEPELAARFAAAPRDRPLGGVPFFAKDLFDFPGTPTFAGSVFLPEVRPAPPAGGSFAHALDAAGAVFAGKTHLHEFAYGITGENPHYGDVDRPGFPGRTTGGSSSGSAAAVAAGLVPFALGSDTGGSVRVPAAFCGVFGLRLAPREPWIADAFPLSPTCDTAGWFTRSGADLRVTLQALLPAADVAGATAPRGLYLELPGLDPEVAAACRSAAAAFSPASDPAAAEALRAAFAPTLEAYHTIVAREAWTVHAAWAERYRERYDPVVWPRLQRAHALTPAQHASADATLAAVRAGWRAYFARYDYLLLPATPCAAPTKAECTPDLRTRLITLTAPASLGGQPVLTIPLALPSGLTTGLQFVVPAVTGPALRWALDQVAP
jgi:aspartyl-tRNA(Asn)/glutamyl-tRNA(Gln) amidotransferase subunit A